MAKVYTQTAKTTSDGAITQNRPPFRKRLQHVAAHITALPAVRLHWQKICAVRLCVSYENLQSSQAALPFARLFRGLFTRFRLRRSGHTLLLGVHASRIS
jgi:hypothetical protein